MAIILVIDDSPSAGAFISEALEADGHTTFTVDSGRRGINFLLRKCFDLIITDIYMPEQDGFEVLMSSRNNAINTPVIAVSTNNGPTDALKAAGHLGAVACLTKPFSAEQIRQVVDRVLGTKRDSVATE